MSVACDVCHADLDGSDLVIANEPFESQEYVDGYLCRNCWQVFGLDEYDNAPKVLFVAVIARLAQECGCTDDEPMFPVLRAHYGESLPPLRLLRPRGTDEEMPSA
jgi:hypothetical protein